MRKIALTIFGALLISGSVVQIAAATEHHKAKAKHHYADFRGAYNQMRPINASVTPPDLRSTAGRRRLGYRTRHGLATKTRRCTPLTNVLNFRVNRPRTPTP